MSGVPESEPNVPVRAGSSKRARFTYRKQHRVRLSREFAAVYDAKLKKSAGPLVVFARPNHMGEHRLGLAVGRRFGNAVRRVRMKRLLREAFRLTRHGLPRPVDGGAYDLVIRVRGHDFESLDRYEAWLREAVERIDRVHRKRVEREDGGGSGGEAGVGDGEG